MSGRDEEQWDGQGGPDEHGRDDTRPESGAGAPDTAPQGLFAEEAQEDTFAHEPWRGAPQQPDPTAGAGDGAGAVPPRPEWAGEPAAGQSEWAAGSSTDSGPGAWAEQSTAGQSGWAGEPAAGAGEAAGATAAAAAGQGGAGGPGGPDNPGNTGQAWGEPSGEGWGGSGGGAWNESGADPYPVTGTPEAGSGHSRTALLVVGGIVLIALLLMGVLGFTLLRGSGSLPGIDLPFIGSEESETDPEESPEETTPEETTPEETTPEETTPEETTPEETTPEETPTPIPPGEGTPGTDQSPVGPSDPPPPSPTDPVAGEIPVVLEVQSTGPAEVTWALPDGSSRTESFDGQWRQEGTVPAEGGYVSLYVVGNAASEQFEVSCRLEANGQEVAQDSSSGLVPTVRCGESVRP